MSRCMKLLERVELQRDSAEADLSNMTARAESYCRAWHDEMANAAIAMNKLDMNPLTPCGCVLLDQTLIECDYHSDVAGERDRLREDLAQSEVGRLDMMKRRDAWKEMSNQWEFLSHQARSRLASRVDGVSPKFHDAQEALGVMGEIE